MKRQARRIDRGRLRNVTKAASSLASIDQAKLAEIITTVCYQLNGRGCSVLAMVTALTLRELGLTKAKWRAGQAVWRLGRHHDAVVGFAAATSHHCWCEVNDDTLVDFGTCYLPTLVKPEVAALFEFPCPSYLWRPLSDVLPSDQLFYAPRAEVTFCYERCAPLELTIRTPRLVQVSAKLSRWIVQLYHAFLAKSAA